MVGGRERSGFLVGVVVTLLVLAALGVWAGRQATDSDPVSWPVPASRSVPPTGPSTTPSSTRSARSRAKAPSDGSRPGRRRSATAPPARTASVPTPRIRWRWVSAAAAAAGAAWVGEVPIDPSADDWEPAIAADPDRRRGSTSSTTRYGAHQAVPGQLPHAVDRARRSARTAARRGAAAKPLCACKGSGQFDPIIEVVPGNGRVYALYMNGFNIMFTKSTDHGATWSAPVKTYGNVSWNDKPVIAMSDNGQHVYVSFNGPTGGDPWVAQSHDAGATWTQTKLVDSNRYYFAFDADVAPNGTVYFAESSSSTAAAATRARRRAARSTSTSSSRRTTARPGPTSVVGAAQPGVACVAAGCPPDFYLGHRRCPSTARGNVVFLYDGATTVGGRQTIWSRPGRRTAGRRGARRSTLSAAGENAATPDGRVARQRRRPGVLLSRRSGGGNVDAWNVWYRSSTDGGATWSAPSSISDATSGAAYKTPAGFAEVYGDYGEIAITNAGKTIAVWGEGASYTGPGGVWINREP